MKGPIPPFLQIWKRGLERPCITQGHTVNKQGQIQDPNPGPTSEPQQVKSDGQSMSAGVNQTGVVSLPVPCSVTLSK